MSTSLPPRILDISRQLTWLAKPGWINGMCFAFLEHVLGFRTLNRYFSRALDGATSQTYSQRLLDEFQISLKISGAGEGAIPQNGAVVMVSNHPFGGADAMAVAAIALRNRPDTKIQANHFLGSIEILQPHLIAVDVYGGVDAIRQNRARVREMATHLAEGNTLVAFPAGEVSSWSWKMKRVTDRLWSGHFAKLARRSDAHVVPVLVKGGNSLFFQLLGMIHPFLRTLWLGRELLRQRGKTVEIVIGEPFSVGDIDHLREKVENLLYLIKARLSV